MRQQLWTGIVAVACTAGLAAAAQTPTQTTPTRSSSQSAANSITVTGCVQRASSSATAGATGTSGTTGSSSSEPHFLLTNAAAGQAAPSSSASSTPTGTSGSTASSYRLDADDAKLTPHIGHKVEITGTIESSSSMPSSSSSAAGATSSSSSSNAPKLLKVDTVRMVASSCSQ